MTTRRRLLIVLGAAPFTPRVVSAQAKKQPVLIGWLGVGRPGPLFAVFKEELAALGWKEGEQIVIEGRWADGQVDRLASLTQELAAKKVVLILASSMRAASRAAKAAPKMPIVMVSDLDPVAAGMATNLARPGGMITGLAGFNIEISGKRVELLLSAAPKVKLVGFLTSSAGPILDRLMEVARRAAAHYGVDSRFAVVTRPEEIDPAMVRLAKEGVQGLVMLPGAVVQGEPRRIVKFALAQGWSVAGLTRTWAENGALLSYATDPRASFRRAAYYVDRILKGTKPGDLPFEQPTTFEFVLNMKTAKALGLTIPPDIMVRVDKVIE